jgi:hypothetical protein
VLLETHEGKHDSQIQEDGSRTKTVVSQCDTIDSESAGCESRLGVSDDTLFSNLPTTSVVWTSKLRRILVLLNIRIRSYPKCYETYEPEVEIERYDIEQRSLRR